MSKKFSTQQARLLVWQLLDSNIDQVTSCLLPVTNDSINT